MRRRAITRVGAGLVDTLKGRAAVTAAGAIAARAGAVLEVITAVQPVDWTGIVAPGPAYHEALSLAREAAAHSARETAEELAPDVPALVHAIVEAPFAALADASDRLHLPLVDRAATDRCGGCCWAAFRGPLACGALPARRPPARPRRARRALLGRQ